MLDFGVVCSFLGHGDITTTDRYLHTTEDDYVDAAAKLGNGSLTKQLP